MKTLRKLLLVMLFTAPIHGMDERLAYYNLYQSNLPNGNPPINGREIDMNIGAHSYYDVDAALDSGISKDIVDSYGRTSLHNAILENNEQTKNNIASILARFGEKQKEKREVSKRYKSKYINLVDTNGNTALHLAAQTGNASIIKTLLLYGASQTRLNYAGLTPLAVAASIGNNKATAELVTARIHYLKSRGIICSEEGDTVIEQAFLIAKQKGKKLFFRKLLETRGYEKNKKDVSSLVRLMR